MLTCNRALQDDHRTVSLNATTLLGQLSTQGEAYLTMTEHINSNMTAVSTEVQGLSGQFARIEDGLADLPARKDLFNIGSVVESAVARAISQHQIALLEMSDQNQSRSNIEEIPDEASDMSNLLQTTPETAQHLDSYQKRRKQRVLYRSWYQTPFLDIFVKTTETEEGSNDQQGIRRRHQDKTFEIRSKVPFWRRGAVVKFIKSMVKSTTSFGMNLRTYNIVPFNSPVSKAIENMDLGTIRRLFDAGLASPYDEDEYGWSLIDSVLYYQRESFSIDSSYSQKAFEIINYIVSCTAGDARTDKVSCLFHDYYHGSSHLENERAQILRSVLRATSKDPFEDSFLPFMMDTSLENNSRYQVLQTQDFWMVDLNATFSNHYPGFYIENDRLMLLDPHGIRMEKAIIDGMEYFPWVWLNDSWDIGYSNGAATIQRLLMLYQRSIKNDVKECCKVRIGILIQHGHDPRQVSCHFTDPGICYQQNPLSSVELSKELGMQEVLHDGLTIAGRSVSEIEDLFEEEIYLGLVELLNGDLEYKSRDDCRTDFIWNLCNGGFTTLRKDEYYRICRVLEINVGLSHSSCAREMIESANSAWLRKSTPGCWPEDEIGLIPGIDFLLPWQFGYYGNGIKMEDIEEWPCVRDILKKAGVDPGSVKRDPWQII